MAKGKTGKYLKYAVGEVILVVIGVLIALQANNWNESFKEQKLMILNEEGVFQSLTYVISHYRTALILYKEQEKSAKTSFMNIKTKAKNVDEIIATYQQAMLHILARWQTFEK